MRSHLFRGLKSMEKLKVSKYVIYNPQVLFLDDYAKITELKIISQTHFMLRVPFLTCCI